MFVYGQVTGSHDGLPLVHMWKQTGEEVCMSDFYLLDPYISAITVTLLCFVGLQVVLVNRLLAERGFCTWFEMQ